MRRVLGVLVVLTGLVLTSCGDDTGGGRGEADKEPRGPVDFTLAQIVHETAVGGLVDAGAVALTDVTAVQQFAGQFDDDRMTTRLIQTFDDLKVPEHQAAYAAIVAVGCEVPTDVTVTSTDTGILIEAVKSGEKPVECFAPVTSVAIVYVDESVVG